MSGPVRRLEMRHSARGLARGLAVVAALATAAMPWTAAADDFYRNKQVKLVVGADVGGSYDLNARLLARFLCQYIPGHPQILVQNMPGAGSVTATNYVFGVAPQDGTVLVAALQTLLQNQLSLDRNVKFDGRQLHWIGNPAASVNVIVTWHTSGVTTIADAVRQSVILGVTSPASSGGMEVALANNVLGTRFQAVTGYKGGNEIDIAMERGEAQGRAGQSWDGWKQTRPDWIRDRKLNVILQIGQVRAKDLRDVPLMTELAGDAEARQVLELYSDGTALGRPLALGPGVAPDKVAILRTAFRDMTRDARFIEEAARLGFEINPIQGEDLQAIVARSLAAPRLIVEKMEAARSLKGGGFVR
jgi:tripartite-type tricarboxylate transporter receptor subunit TctC